METVEIDKKIASLKEEIEKLEKQKKETYKKSEEYWLGKYVTNGIGKFYIYGNVKASNGGISCDTVNVYIDESHNVYTIYGYYPEFFSYDCLTEITKEEFMNEFNKCISVIKKEKLSKRTLNK